MIEISKRNMLSDVVIEDSNEIERPKIFERINFFLEQKNNINKFLLSKYSIEVISVGCHHFVDIERLIIQRKLYLDMFYNVEKNNLNHRYGIMLFTCDHEKRTNYNGLLESFGKLTNLSKPDVLKFLDCSLNIGLDLASTFNKLDITIDYLVKGVPSTITDNKINELLETIKNKYDEITKYMEEFDKFNNSIISLKRKMDSKFESELEKVYFCYEILYKPNIVSFLKAIYKHPSKVSFFIDIYNLHSKKFIYCVECNTIFTSYDFREIPTDTSSDVKVKVELLSLQEIFLICKEDSIFVEITEGGPFNISMRSRKVMLSKDLSFFLSYKLNPTEGLGGYNNKEQINDREKNYNNAIKLPNLKLNNVDSNGDFKLVITNPQQTLKRIQENEIPWDDRHVLACIEQGGYFKKDIAVHNPASRQTIFSVPDMALTFCVKESIINKLKK